MNSKHSLIQTATKEESPLTQESQGNTWDNKTAIKETKMKLTTFVASVLLSSSLLATDVQAKPDMTEEQLEKARKTALSLKPPVDFDELMSEAERLGVDCKGELSHRVVLKTCKLNVESAQSRERQAKLDRDIEGLRKENAMLDAELKKRVDELANMADKKLNE